MTYHIKKGTAGNNKIKAVPFSYISFSPFAFALSHTDELVGHSNRIEPLSILCFFSKKGQKSAVKKKSIVYTTRTTADQKCLMSS